MTPEDVIRGFREEVEQTCEEKEYANTLFQEAIKTGMEINQTYHTPEELVKLMGKLTGKAVDKSFRLFPPFYTDFGKNIIFGKDVFLNSGCHFQDQGGIEIGDGVLIGHPLGGRGYTADLLGNEVISKIAQAHEKSSAQIILRWDLQNGVVVIPGSSNPDHIMENTQLYDFELTDEEMEQIDALEKNEKHDWY